MPMQKIKMRLQNYILNLVKHMKAWETLNKHVKLIKMPLSDNMKLLQITRWNMY